MCKMKSEDNTDYIIILISIQTKVQAFPVESQYFDFIDAELLRAVGAQPRRRKPAFVTYDNEASMCVMLR